eukprot:UN01300
MFRLQQLIIIFLYTFVCTQSLHSAPVLSPSDAEHRTKQDSNEQFAYSTKIKKSQYFHHHYIYHESNKNKMRRHDHEIKIPTEERILKLYHMIDINKDDIISKNELQSLLHVHKYPKHHPKHDDLIETAIKRLDLNSDGIIEKDEYLIHMKKSTKAFSEDLLFSKIPKEDLIKFENLI